MIRESRISIFSKLWPGPLDHPGSGRTIVTLTLCFMWFALESACLCTLCLYSSANSPVLKVCVLRLIFTYSTHTQAVSRIVHFTSCPLVRDAHTATQPHTHTHTHTQTTTPRQTPPSGNARGGQHSSHLYLIYPLNHNNHRETDA